MKLFSIATALLSGAAFVSSLSLTIRNDVAGNSSSPILYGLMYEDINRCGDSGLYGQMLRNWNFQASDNGTAATTEFWNAIGSGKIALDKSKALNDANPNALRLDVGTITDRAGFSNEGWWGLRVQPDETYTASFYAMSPSYTGALNVTLETSDGKVLASKAVTGLSDTYKQFTVDLAPSVSEVSTDNVFSVSVSSSEAENASIYFSVFSLFGETYKDRANGLRGDIGDTLAGLNPSFFRFPGGNNLEGESIDTRWKWNETIGPLDERIGRMGDWGYWNTNGQGLLDYMYMCEDMGIEPVLGVYAGYSLDKSSVAEDDLEPYVQEVMNELEYLMGDASTTYGALRKSHGRSDPFTLNYVEIGNEDFFSTTYDYRYKAFYDAIIAKYPKLNIIETTGQTSSKYNILDDHYYADTKTMIGYFNLYDNHPRNGTGIFVGEFGTNVNGCCGQSPANLQAALADAVFITGLERNSDYVKMVAYAPGMTREGQQQWNPDFIHFDTESVWVAPSYLVVKEWSTHRADTILQVDATDGGFSPLYWVAGSNKDAKQVYIKMVNTDTSAQTVSFNLKSASAKTSGVARVITGNLDDENTKTSTAVDVAESKFTLNSSSAFDYTFAANSATVLILDLQ